MPEVLNTECLLDRIKQNDQSAMKELFENCYTPLYKYAIRFVEAELAKDFIQDVFYELYTRRKRLEIHSSLNGYLFRMMRNRCMRYWEREKIRLSLVDDPLPLLKQEEIRFTEEELEKLIGNELEEKIHDCLQQLPDRCREVFYLSRFEGLRNKEIAERLDISVKAVEKHISKALKFLRTELKDYLPLLLFFLN